LDVYRTEEEQIAAIRDWWRQNGKPIIAGVIIGAGAVFGWRAWEAHVEALAQEASERYQKILIEVRAGPQEKLFVIRDQADALIRDYPRTPYAGFAALMLARLAAEAGDTAEAARRLEWVIDHFGSEPLGHLARLRLLRLLVADQRHAEALALIDKTSPGEFGAQYEELRGDILLAQGKISEARAAYQRALNLTDPAASGRNLLELKADNLGRDETPASLR
jgi:predicted negative regulator of RcsB-dependent stress response